MSEWQQSVLTAKARDLHAKVEAGELTLNLTKIKLGSGTLENTDNVDTMTDIKHVEQEVGISAKTPKEGGICSITGIITNSSVNVGFYVKELGLFAQDESGTEFLYAYMTDARPDYQPSKDYGGAPVTASYSIDVAISNASKITVMVDPVGLVTTKILDQKISEHNDSDTAHSNVFKSLFNVATVTGDAIKAKIKDYAMEKISEWIAEQGIRYNIAQNGYICFGELFGNAILQWGLIDTTTAGIFTDILPITFNKAGLQAVATWDNPSEEVNWDGISSFIFAIKPTLKNIIVARNNKNVGSKSFRYLVVGI